MLSSIRNNDHIKLLFGAIGIIYGDIGTSPLYAVKSALTENIPLQEAPLIGIISVFIWTIFMVVTVKYVFIILNIDSQGNGGILVLSSVCARFMKKKYSMIMVIPGIIGGALLFADGSITPAVSVLSALEGLEIVMPISQHYVVLLSCIIITLLFLAQKKGSGVIGHYFGAVMIVWFIVLAVLGVISIIRTPQILIALNPYYGILFLHHHGPGIFASVILAVTGAEAIYADLGHFGKSAIRQSWLCFVFPALILNYLGQGALLLRNPGAIVNPFYYLVPQYLLYPLILLATVSTIIASQAIISGIFSLSWQAIMLNYLPKMQVEHTSNKHIGQVYVPTVNLILYCFTIFAILHFQSSGNLTSAYGLSIAGLMFITTLLAMITMYENIKSFLYKGLLILLPLLCLDAIFIIGNFAKVFSGAWYAILITVFVTFIVQIWRENSEIANKRKFPDEQLTEYIKQHCKLHKRRIPGSAIFMSSEPNKIPNSLKIHLQHNKLLHENIMFLSIIISDVPRVPLENKFVVIELMKKIFTVTAEFGFDEVPDVNQIITWAKKLNIFNDDEISCFLSRTIPVVSRKYNPFTLVFNEIYVFLVNNSLSYYEFLKIPYKRVIELCSIYRI